jgi:hypothetical protein
LWGDSAAAALYSGMQARNNGDYNILLLSSAACPSLSTDYRFPHEFPNCGAANEFTLNYIRSSRPSIVVLSMAPNYEGDLASEIGKTIERLKDAGISQTIVVGPPPIWPYSLLEFLVRKYGRTEIPQRNRITRSAA